MPLNKISRILMPALLSLSTASFSFAVQAAERGRIRSLQGKADLLQHDLAPGINTPTFVNGGARDSAALDNNMNNLEGLHISQNRLSAPKSERDVLIEFYDATNGDNWENNTNWKSNKPLSEWYGITTDSSGRVTELKLRNNQLTGSIPAALGNLNNLTELDLASNKLRGSIPTALGNLSNLKKLDLSNSKSAKEIARIDKDIARTSKNIQLHNEIQRGIGELGSLLGIEDEDNTSKQSLKEGKDYEKMAKYYEQLATNINILTGPIPTVLGNLNNLTELNLGGNELTGPIPPALGNLTNLRELNLYDNQLSGRIPAALGNLTNLRLLDLSDNQLSGRIPPALGNLTKLARLYLNDNQLTGRIPAALGNLNNLKSLNLSYNQLTGRIPAALGNLTKLKTLDLDGNQLTGSIPAALKEALEQ
ncbi:MAG: hypothetical protein ERJ67_08755 [Aphanocapsa feldmannii 277cV]|uniref:Disease resistance R13L4/SHOC-2-like LRR domain-containing protein n=1 Tax=Aphanocapsa feldmannii 277cV TaxID=2507553 RepID=A0A524RL79_9CHRO|nr:MAG: hypothetical protein ERJ67_08755 [Aphanocapsa feldmannii 277cV]